MKGATMIATGPMEVGTTPDTTTTTSYQRFTLLKRYTGPLEAAGEGEMLTGGDPKTGAAGYVAIEAVAGTLNGATGTFQLMQFGTFMNGTPELRCVVVPGSGTEGFTGLSGTMQFDRSPDGKHTYTLDYTLPGQ